MFFVHCSSSTLESALRRLAAASVSPRGCRRLMVCSISVKCSPLRKWSMSAVMYRVQDPLVHLELAGLVSLREGLQECEIVRGELCDGIVHDGPDRVHLPDSDGLPFRLE